MTNESSARVDPIAEALAATQRRLHRKAVLRLALYGWFSLMSMAAFVLLGREWSLHGSVSLVTAWPAFVLQAVAALALVWLLWRQFRSVAELRARSRSVRAAAHAQLRVVQRDCRQSMVLTGLALLAVPALMYALTRLVASGAVAGKQSVWLAALCLLPSIVIACVHLPRLSRLQSTRRALQLTLRQLDGEC